jgi:hypothetical protein
MKIKPCNKIPKNNPFLLPDFEKGYIPLQQKKI